MTLLLPRFLYLFFLFLSLSEVARRLRADVSDCVFRSFGFLFMYSHAGVRARSPVYYKVH
jgi:hypothetical protein